MKLFSQNVQLCKLQDAHYIMYKLRYLQNSRGDVIFRRLDRDSPRYYIFYDVLTVARNR